MERFDGNIVRLDFRLGLEGGGYLPVVEGGAVEHVGVAQVERVVLRKLPRVLPRAEALQVGDDEVRGVVGGHGSCGLLEELGQHQVVRVQREDVLPSGFPDPEVTGVSQAPVQLVHHAHAVASRNVFLHQAARHVPARVRGAVVHHHDLPIGERLVDHRF
eukprot:1193420-Prorocentrum_minimum.AAC.4